MDGAFNIQRALTDMEARIREDIKESAQLARDDFGTAFAKAEEAHVETVKLDGRMKSVEEKMGWFVAGFGATLLSVLGFVWHVLTSPITGKH